MPTSQVGGRLIQHPAGFLFPDQVGQGSTAGVHLVHTRRDELMSCAAARQALQSIDGRSIFVGDRGRAIYRLDTTLPRAGLPRRTHSPVQLTPWDAVQAFLCLLPD